MITLIEVEVLEPVDLFARGLIDAPQARSETWKLNADSLLSQGWTVKEIADAFVKGKHLPETSWVIARSALDRWSAKYPRNTLRKGAAL